jgi:hypothetical protein
MTTLFTTDARTSLDDALYALAQGGPVRDAAALDALVRRFPDYAEELTELVIELALDALDGDDNAEAPSSSTAETNSAVSEAMSHFHNRLYEVQTAERITQTKPLAKPQNPFAALDRTEMRALGTRLNANTVFVIKLRDRLIQADTISQGFKRRLAEEIKAPFDVIAAHFSGPSLIGSPAHYKADQKPEVGKAQTFDEAVRSSGLTDEQQSYLLSL